MGWRNPGPLVTTLGALSVLFWLGVTLEAVGRAGCRGAAVVAGNVMQAGLGVFITVLTVYVLLRWGAAVRDGWR